MVPDLHEQLWCSSSGDSCVMRGVSNVFMRLSSLLACLNSALNFFIYYVSSVYDSRNQGVYTCSKSIIHRCVESVSESRGGTPLAFASAAAAKVVVGNEVHSFVRLVNGGRHNLGYTSTKFTLLGVG